MDTLPFRFFVKKPSKSKPARPARRKKPRTGVDDQFGFFIGGEDTVAGLKHSAGRRRSEHSDMPVYQIVRRVLDDVTELSVRAYQSAAYEQFLRKNIIKGIADRVSPDLLQRLTVGDEGTRVRAWEEYNQYLDSLLADEPRRAANGLAYIAKQTALDLENLFVKRRELMRAVAGGLDLWPVNLGLKTRATKGGRQQVVTRKDFADGYLKGLNLNRTCKHQTGHRGGAKQVSPITLAAESLYQTLRLLRDSRFAFMEDTPWARRLLALPLPMTESNAARWWKVAKVWLYERWNAARHEFSALEKYLRLGPLDAKKYPYESRIKSRVIDDALKKAFLALAEPNL